MKAYLLSRRHREGKPCCLICDDWRHAVGIALPPQKSQGYDITVTVVVHICTACIREAGEIARKGRKAQKP